LSEVKAQSQIGRNKRCRVNILGFEGERYGEGDRIQVFVEQVSITRLITQQIGYDSIEYAMAAEPG